MGAPFYRSGGRYQVNAVVVKVGSFVIFSAVRYTRATKTKFVREQKVRARSTAPPVKLSKIHLTEVARFIVVSPIVTRLHFSSFYGRRIYRKKYVTSRRVKIHVRVYTHGHSMCALREIRTFQK